MRVFLPTGEVRESARTDEGGSEGRGETGDSGAERGMEVAGSLGSQEGVDEAGEGEGEGGGGGGEGLTEGGGGGEKEVGEGGLTAGGGVGGGGGREGDTGEVEMARNCSIDGSDTECGDVEEVARRPSLDRPLGSRDPTPPILLSPEDDDRLVGGPVAGDDDIEVGVEPGSHDPGMESHDTGRGMDSSATSPLHSGDIHDGFIFAIHRKKVSHLHCLSAHTCVHPSFEKTILLHVVK